MSRVLSTGITDEEEIRRILRDEGYTNIFRWCDSAGTRYGEHTHPHQEVRWVLSGTLEIIKGGMTLRLKSGDRLDSAPDTPHSAYVPEDCCYLCGSK
ncbi:cupin domain-containing protein [Nitratifractor salsuginis]|uniref:Cupin 2 conserved barrel domain protein n=1 Tax=Nitratifractor salsuginis (strain DSM 16511 / JCM 12458 / E9I37-1) TaxID=749222 RepID=E6WY03_NITSE|nr:cupin domain-containing protein [Nitratifractor salsuginis]ADV46377.1 Cupin 2 conserved barrel domain protein [Nitratifractor salsuginis DSM 16511]